MPQNDTTSNYFFVHIHGEPCMLHTRKYLLYFTIRGDLDKIRNKSTIHQLKKTHFCCYFCKIVSPLFTTLTTLINKLINATPRNAPHATLINNWIDINTCK